MIQGWLVQFAIGFILRQVGKFHDSIDWAKVKRDLDIRVRNAFPGTWFDEDAVAVVDWVVDTCAKTMVDNALNSVIASVLAGNWTAAVMSTKALLFAAADKENLVKAVLAA